MKLSPTQLRVLRYASEGRLVFSHFRGSYFLDRQELAPGALPIGPVRERELARLDVTDGIVSKVVVTPKGAALLEEQGDA